MDIRTTVSRVFMGIVFGFILGLVLYQVTGIGSGGINNNVLSGQLASPVIPSCNSPADGLPHDYECCIRNGKSPTYCCRDFPLTCPTIHKACNDGDADAVCGDICPERQECIFRRRGSDAVDTCGCDPISTTSRSSSSSRSSNSSSSRSLCCNTTTNSCQPI